MFTDSFRSIHDQDAPFVTDSFYEHLFSDGEANRATAAEALHVAVKKLRESGASFERWVPFIHLGL